VTSRPERATGGFRFNTEISLGSILQAAMVFVVSAFFYVTNASNKTDNTAQRLVSVENSVAMLRSEVLQKISDNQAENKIRFEELSRQVAGLPDQTAALRQLDARVTRLEANKQDRDKQITDLSNVLYQDHADLAAIQLANRQKLGVR
jgi:uncharacterized coiled-coil protein SlyX